LRDTEVQQPNTTATLSLVMSSRAFSANSGQFEAGRRRRPRAFAEHAALLVLLVDQEEDGILQRGLADGHGAGERVQDADLDGVVGGCRRRNSVEAARPKTRPAVAANQPRRLSVAIS
jgi:hypothetical protein